MNGIAYVTFLLRALGYDDSSANKDFSYSGSVDYAKSINLLEEDLYFKIVSSPFTRDYVAKSSYNALFQKVKGESVSLIEKLVSGGDITQAQLDAMNSAGSDKELSSTDRETCRCGRFD
jgi:hypothetical protein